MHKTKFRNIIRKSIEEHSLPKEMITKSTLKEVIKQILRTILMESNSFGKPTGKMTGPYSVYSNINRKYYSARKNEDNGCYYYLHPDTGTEVSLGPEGPNLSVQKDLSHLKEMTTTGDVAPINLPGNVTGGWVSKQGGSKRGIAGSAALGYTLTPIGKKDMARKQDPV